MDEEGVKLIESSEKGPEVMGDAQLEEIDFAPLVDYFGMDRPSLEEKNDLRSLYNEVQKQGMVSKADFMSYLRSIEMKIGAAPISENRMRRLLNYIKLDNDAAEIMKERDTYVR